MQTFETILPIFLVIGLGWFAHQRGFIPSEFLSPANRVTYYFAIPALVFRAISRASITREFHGQVLIATLSAVALAYGIAWLYCFFKRITSERAGGVIQCAAHGNLGLVGLPLSFYLLGDSGLAKAGILSGFLMILHNLLSVSIMQAFSSKQAGAFKPGHLLKKLFSNPVILGSLSGIAVSALEISLPNVAERSIDMLSGLAPPMSLLLIGASISLKAVKKYFRAVFVSAFIKLLILPAIGLLIYRFLELDASEYLPGLVLLCCPTATIAYLMAKEMDGDIDYVSAAISTTTLFSAVTFTFWFAFV